MTFPPSAEPRTLQASFFGSESLKISGLPLWALTVNDWVASSTTLSADLGRTLLSIVQLQRRVELLLVCTFSLTLARVNLAQLSWPRTTNTHFVTQQFGCPHICAPCLSVWCNKLCALVSNAGSFVRVWTYVSARLSLMCQKRRLNKSGADSDAESPANRTSSGNASRLEPHLLSL